MLIRRIHATAWKHEGTGHEGHPIVAANEQHLVAAGSRPEHDDGGGGTRNGWSAHTARGDWRSNSATASMCSVCGNMSTPRIPASRNPPWRKRRCSVASFSGLQDT